MESEAFIPAGIAWEWASFIPLLAITAATLWYIYQSQDNSKLPPGPKGVPLLGYIPFLGKNHHLKFAELAKVYGPIVRIKYGMVNVVVLNDYASVKKWLTHTAFQSRLRNVFYNNTGLLGIGTLNGEAWRTNRRLCLGILRDNGWKKAVLEEQTKEELQYFCCKLAEHAEKPAPIKPLAMASMANGVMKILMGVSYPFGDPRRMLLDRHMAQRKGQRAPDVLEENSSLDFTDAFLKETCEYRKAPDSHISVKYAAGHVLGLLSAGANAVSSIIVWHLLNCADKPGLQNKIWEEIDRVIGQQRTPAWGDRYNMPFTMACIWETYRWRTMNPIGIPRGCEEDTSIDNYVIPKGTIVLPNLWAVHMDPTLWKDPEVFDPSRFLKDDGSGLIAKPEHLMPFSVGKRMCPGEAASNIQIFLYLTGVLQKFIVMPEDGVAVDLSVDCVTFNNPKMQNLRFIPRY